jgi:hypothetical protein
MGPKKVKKTKKQIEEEKSNSLAPDNNFDRACGGGAFANRGNGAQDGS